MPPTSLGRRRSHRRRRSTAADTCVKRPRCAGPASSSHPRSQGSASATVKHFREQHLRFPRRPRGGPRKGELLWETLRHWRVLRVLHNPRYAGIYCFGRTQTRKLVGGGVETRTQPREQWTALVPDAHPGYITGEQYEANLRQLRANAQAYGAERRKSPPREGPALLQGQVICGRCGRRMTVRYHGSDARQRPDYLCQREGIETRTDRCQVIPGAGIDQSIGELLLRTVSPVSLEVALQVQAELDARIHEADALRQQQVERALRCRLGAASVHAGRPRQPLGRRRAGSGVEREPARTSAQADAPQARQYARHLTERLQQAMAEKWSYTQWLMSAVLERSDVTGLAAENSTPIRWMGSPRPRYFAAQSRSCNWASADPGGDISTTLNSNR
ncbi:MAG: recombinase family protein [Spirochaetaceae bacterium]|nr:recombinase family protein [Spirochaetaceae bacterium]